MKSFRPLQLVVLLAVVFSLACGAPDAPCACTDETPKNGVPCEDQRAMGNCSLPWMKKNNYCSISCGFCKCDEDVAPAPAPASTNDCEWCTDIPPAGAFTCEEQGALGKCARGWMDGYCLRTCKKCSCDNPPVVGEGPVEPTAPEGIKASATPTTSFEIPRIVNETIAQASQVDSNSTVAVDDASEPDTSLSEKVQEVSGGNATQVTAEETQVQANSTDTIPTVVEADEDLQVQSNSTDAGVVMDEGLLGQDNSTAMAPSGVVVDEGLLGENNSTDAAPAGVVMGEGLSTQTNLTGGVPTGAVMDEGLPEQNNSTATVATGVLVDEGLPEQNNSTTTVVTGAMVDEGLPEQNNSTTTVVTGVMVDEGSQAQNNSSAPVPTAEKAEEVSVGGEDALGGQVGNEGIEALSSPIAPDVSPEPEMENNQVPGAIGMNSTSVGSSEKNATGTDSTTENVIEDTSVGVASIPVPESVVSGEEPGSTSIRPDCQTIMELISRDENLTKLRDAVRVADIELALEDSAMDITFFAPTNAAFQTLSNLIGDGAAEVLSRPEVMKLVLSNHASRPGRSVNEILNAQTISTLSIVEGNTSELKVTRGPDGKALIDGKINRAQILTADIRACGGYLHVIDAVLVPVGYSELKQVS